MMIVRSFLLLFSVVPVFFGVAAHAGTNSEQIFASVSAFMTDYHRQLSKQYGDAARIEYDISKIDPRLTMAHCPEPLVVKLKSLTQIGRVNAKVSCEETSHWSVYVPIHIKLFRQVVVAAVPMDRGTLLTETMLQLREMDVSRLRGTYYTRLEDVAGMQTRRSISPDIPLTSQQIEQPIMIRRGEAVQVTANSGGLEVKIAGIALMDGRVGQQISVRNRQSKRVIEAKVVAPGQVIVPM